MQTKEIIEEIAETFADTSNKSIIDLVKLRDFVNKDRNASENQIFMKKLRDLDHLDAITKP